MDSDNNERPRSYKRINLWSAGDTQLMLDLCGNYLFQIGPMKKFRNKKQMWAKIATRFPNKSAKQCEERFKTVLKRKNTRNDPRILKAKKQTSPIQIINEHIKLNAESKAKLQSSIKSIQIINDNIKLEAEAKVELSNKNKKEKEYNNECSISVQETLWKIAEQHEVANKMRHKEEMEAMEKITLLQQILEEKWKKKLI